ncbi:hypothetical protein EV424DRAFT_753613 [Suillus variegatus]|nr:hypothetical protein EV424DRAFT_753613 [Suillus variegatus]
MLPVEKGRRLGRQPVTRPFVVGACICATQGALLDAFLPHIELPPNILPLAPASVAQVIYTTLPHPSCILSEPLLAGQCRHSDDWSGYRMSDPRIRCHVNENHIIWPSTTCPLAADIHYGIKYLGLRVCHGHSSTYFYSMERKGHHSSPYSYHRVSNIESFFLELARGGIQRWCSINDHEHLAASSCHCLTD